jgi:hypothetical protein
MLTINGGMTFGSGSFLDLRAAAVHVSELIVEDSLFVMGDLTIEGLATFLGNLNVKGELIISNKQAGFAMIPKTGTSVTVYFGSGLSVVPVVTVTPNGPTGSWWAGVPTQTGFTIYVAEPMLQDTLFSWIALGTDGSVTFRAEITDNGDMIFPLDSKNVPVSSNATWNACIRNVPRFDDEGKPLSCSRYHDNYTWSHPDLGISFIWNTSMTPSYLKVPDGFTPTVTETAESVENAFKPFEEGEDDETETGTGSSISSASSATSSGSSVESAATVSSSSSSVSSEASVSSAFSSSAVSESASSAASSESASSVETSSSASSVSSEASVSSAGSSVSSAVVIELPFTEDVQTETPLPAGPASGSSEPSVVTE